MESGIAKREIATLLYADGQILWRQRTRILYATEVDGRKLQMGTEHKQEKTQYIVIGKKEMIYKETKELLRTHEL